MTSVSATSVIRSALNNRADVAMSALEARSCHSWKMNLDRADILAKADDFIGHPSFHLYLGEGTGGRVADLDGNSFIDLSMGFGAQLLGHGTQSIQEAVMTQAAQGWHYGLANEREIELARLVCAASPSNERVLSCNSGCDATALALRAARAHTGRDLIAAFAGSSHGTHDYGCADEQAYGCADGAEALGLFARPWQRKGRARTGIPQAVRDTTVSLAYGHSSAFDQLRRRRRDLAAVIVEPVRAIDPSFDSARWLRELANVCGECGILLILDERLTGFRLAYGGAQERLGVMADLIAYGENVAGGLPLGIVAGRADILCSLGREPFVRSLAERGVGANMLSIAAGAATLESLSMRRATLYPPLEEKGHLLAEGFNAFTAANDIPARMRIAGSLFRIVFKRADCANGIGYPAAESAFYALTLNKGVLMHASRLGFLSAAHTVGDLARVTSAFQEALVDVKDDGLFELKA